jgi:hypothetical protein
MASTTIYEPLHESGYEFCHPVDHGGFRTIADLCNGTERANMWKPPKMELIRVDEGRTLVESDSPWFGSDVLVLRPRQSPR